MAVVQEQPISARLAPACLAAACVAVVDGLPELVPPAGIVLSKVDDLAHLATAALLVVLVRPSVRFGVATLVAAVAIDIDHLPAELGWDGLTAGSGRPYSHSLAIVVLSLGLALLPGRARLVAAGAACGFALHLWRDVVTGPGVPLWWPLSLESVRLPYVIYALSLAVAVALVAVRAVRSERYRSS
jgi:inner membrane protein